MKKAIVSSVYEGRRSSRWARMNARARKYGCRAKVVKAEPFVFAEKRIKTTSMIMKSMEEKKEEVYAVDEEKAINNEVVAEPEIDIEAVLESPKSGNGEIVEPEETGGEAIANTSNAVKENGGDEPVWWEEYWPWCWSYEEEMMWLGTGSECRPFWEVMTGGGGCVDAKQDEDEPWGDDIWNLRDIKEVPNNMPRG